MSIVLVDDHKIVRDGLRAILEKAGLHVSGEASNGRDAFAVVRRVKPGVVLMDISMPELNGIDATRRLTAELPDIKVIALSMHSDRRSVVSMFKAGAVGYLPKNVGAEELLHAIKVVGGGLTYVSPTIASQVVGDMVVGRSAEAPELSLREREVLQLIAEGKSSKEVAAKLGVSVPTVETHRRNISEKLKLYSIAELTKYAIREGLTTLD